SPSPPPVATVSAHRPASAAGRASPTTSCRYATPPVLRCPYGRRWRAPPGQQANGRPYPATSGRLVLARLPSRHPLPLLRHTADGKKKDCGPRLPDPASARPRPNGAQIRPVGARIHRADTLEERVGEHVVVGGHNGGHRRCACTEKCGARRLQLRASAGPALEPSSTAGARADVTRFSHLSVSRHCVAPSIVTQRAQHLLRLAIPVLLPIDRNHGIRKDKNNVRKQGLKCSVTASSPQQPSPTFTVAASSLGSSLSSEHTVRIMLNPPSCIPFYKLVSPDLIVIITRVPEQLVEMPSILL
ncbi:hypothetical protein U9M48_012769, partial [Paspalum notatum var. saurae]